MFHIALHFPLYSAMEQARLASFLTCSSALPPRF